MIFWHKSAKLQKPSNSALFDHFYSSSRLQPTPAPRQHLSRQHRFPWKFFWVFSHPASRIPRSFMSKPPSTPPPPRHWGLASAAPRGLLLPSRRLLAATSRRTASVSRESPHSDGCHYAGAAVPRHHVGRVPAGLRGRRAGVVGRAAVGPPAGDCRANVFARHCIRPTVPEAYRGREVGF